MMHTDLTSKKQTQIKLKPVLLLTFIAWNQAS